MSEPTPADGLHYAVREGIAIITLSRPERLNAFTREMAAGLRQLFDIVDTSDDVRAVIITGAGRGFCAGADLSRAGMTFDRGGDEDYDPASDVDFGGVLVRRIYDCYKPVIAAINGPAVGMGASLTLAADVRLASNTAKIGFVFTRRGLVPESCSSWFLPRIVGISQAAEWIYSGRVFEADEALRTGLVRSVHAPEDLLAAADAIAHDMVDHSAPVAVALSRRMLWRMLGASSPAAAHEVESRGVFHLGRGPDVHEGVEAFLEKREPAFPLHVSTDLPGFVADWLY